MIISITITAAIIAMICDAKFEDSHRLRVRRLYRKIRKAQQANAATQLDNLFYTSNIGK